MLMNDPIVSFQTSFRRPTDLEMLFSPIGPSWQLVSCPRTHLQGQAGWGLGSLVWYQLLVALPAAGGWSSMIHGVPFNPDHRICLSMISMHFPWHFCTQWDEPGRIPTLKSQHLRVPINCLLLWEQSSSITPLPTLLEHTRDTCSQQQFTVGQQIP